MSTALLLPCAITIVFNRDWQHLPSLRTFLQNVLTVGLTKDSATTPERVAMAVSELMENAVKYASDDQLTLNLQIGDTGPDSLLVSVKNNALAGQISEVQQQFDKAMSGDPLETYVAMMKEAVTRTDGKSQLGLIRIRHESGCELKLQTGEDWIEFSLTLAKRKA
jgi:hypothetical protein